MNKPTYPPLSIHSKKQLESLAGNNKAATVKEWITLCSQDCSKLWRDNVRLSDPTKDKFVRTAKGTALGKLLTLLDRRVLKPHDELLPPYLFGGLHKRNHIQAALNLVGTQNERIFIFLDLQRFFEQITFDRIVDLLYKDMGCSLRAARWITNLVCVPEGPKNQPTGNRVLARGFPTSSRIAIWVCLKFFSELNNLLKHRWSTKHDARLSIFVDDIGISVSDINSRQAQALVKAINRLAEKHSLIFNPTKIRVLRYDEAVTHLGLQIKKNRVIPSRQTQGKLHRYQSQLNRDPSNTRLKQAIKGLKSHVFQVHQHNLSRHARTS